MALEVKRDIRAEGRHGEELVLSALSKIPGVCIGQIDWFVEESGKLYAIEVKHKERYKWPPFYGHGLEVRQLKHRLMLFDIAGIQPLLFVKDPDIPFLIWNNLAFLHRGKEGEDWALTETKNIVVYPFKHFYRWREDSRLAHRAVPEYKIDSVRKERAPC